MAKVLVIGGAGYVGSATVAALVDRGHSVTILDDLSTGHRELALSSDLVVGKAGDSRLVEEILRTRAIECVMHFAAKSLVGESFQKRAEYFENNVTQARALIETMLRAGVKRFIFSSTCAIFGDPGERPITEDLPKAPVSPYGETKLEFEQFLQGEARAKGLHSVALRYFNAAGAEPRARIGEWHEPESHLIPRVLAAAHAGTTVDIFGEDYPTRDGTCIRDYVHVWDLASAHIAAMQKMFARELGADGHFESLNIGSENGFTVREVIAASERVTGKRIATRVVARRAGDPARLVANSVKARRAIAYSPEFTHIDEIVSSAWHWELRRKGQLRKAVFLDRDGTLNFDPGYLKEPADLKLLDGVGPALKRLKDAGYLLVVVTNQSGVGRGWVPEAALPRIHERMQELLKPAGVAIDHFEICIHRPDEDCACRKPKCKLIWDSARKLGVALEQSYMVGDKSTDLEAGARAGCAASFLVRTGSGREAEQSLREQGAQFMAEQDLAAVAERIVTRA